jgi:3'-5' exoribonuclease
LTNMDAPELNQLSEGQQAELVCLLAKKQIAQTKAGKPYGSLKLADCSGEVEAKLWDQAEELLEDLEPGAAVKVTGRVESFNGRRQIVLRSIEPAPDADPTQFMPKSPIKPSELWGRLTELTLAVKNKRLRRLLKIFFENEEFLAEFGKAPAAKSAHHAYVHGLLEHTVSVGEMALKIAEHYKHLNRDILLSGALLHDIGKTQEFSLGPPIEYTDAGRLEGHVVLGVRMLDKRLASLRGFPENLASHLRHLIISHHGLYEFGSPKKPKTPEALVLHMLDDLDAKTAMIQEIVAAEGGGEAHWSSFNRLLERFVYTGPSPLEKQNEPTSGEANPSSAQTMELFGK